ncbi:CGNR zinc finger domain-containing protein [Sediminivirga luteola]|uniref:CGNR zinc finger domain-containing protein n=1 Tax=Sediminivirga luteola TaxID=1774748 RepID=UPI003BB48C2C
MSLDQLLPVPASAGLGSEYDRRHTCRIVRITYLRRSLLSPERIIGGVLQPGRPGPYRLRRCAAGETPGDPRAAVVVDISRNGRQRYCSVRCTNRAAVPQASHTKPEQPPVANVFSPRLPALASWSGSATAAARNRRPCTGAGSGSAAARAGSGR